MSPTRRSLPMVRPLADLRERVIAAAAALPAKTRRQRRLHLVALALAGVTASSAVFWTLGGVRITGRPLGLIAGTVLGTSLIGAWSLWRTAHTGGEPLGRSTFDLLSSAVVAVALMLGWKIAWSANYPGAMDPWPSRPGLRCLGLSLAMALGPLLAFVSAKRGSDPLHPAATGLATGMAIGTAANVLTDLWCPVAYVPHLLLGHVLPTLLLGAAGAGLGSRLIRIDSR